MKANGLAFYRPHEKQHAFHSANAKRRGFFAGNRTGKSEAEAAETVAWFIGERTWYKYRFPIYGMRDGKKVIVEMHDGHENHPLVRQGIPSNATKQLIITTDWKKVDLVWTSPLGDPPGKIWKFMPADEPVATKRNHEGIIDQIFHERTGAVIRFTTEQSFIKNPQAAESTENDRIGVDEPIVEEFWKAASRGLIDRNGQGDFALTALRERWIWDYFNPEDLTTVRDDRFAVRASMEDNPYLTPEAKERFIAELNEDEKAARVQGIPLELTGLVYKEFHREKHVLKTLPAGWTAWNNPPADYTIYVSIDVHSQTPQAAMFLCVPPVGQPIIYDEIWKKLTADELAFEIVQRLAGRVVGFIKADPRAWDEDPVYRVSMAQRFQAHGLPVEKASKAKTFGIMNMRTVLSRPDGVRFVPTVSKTLWEITRYHYDKENEPVDKDDHFMECMYRLFVAEQNLVHISAQAFPSLPQFEIPMTRRVLDSGDVEGAYDLDLVRINS